ncbi:hypothetical protein BFN03_01190 [Rhodococcus sp. WMMA185]|uniref:hypothetical protein n=1 Tax=Rhodococcus sp. WMMA185 TaxID=679318 RepID=UPI000878CA94|nr:hypothetical protein [Rhodococcus sp. WMMA185]AOW91772.1 hypothetical protein BFN03_01190 [Rhodococcus sp. WMMA185]
MNLRRFTATSLLVVAAMGVGSATAYADPSTGQQSGAEQAIPNINFETTLVDGAAVTTIDAGLFSINAGNDTIDVVDDAGNVVTSIPSFFRVDDLQHPFEVAVDETERVLSLVPNMDPAVATAVPAEERLTLQDVAAPADQDERDALALDDFQQQFGITTAIADVVATILGGVVGCAIGLIPGTAAMVGAPFLGITAPIGGCIAGALLVAPVATLAGTILAGGGGLVVHGMHFFDTINSPFVAPGETAPVA